MSLAVRAVGLSKRFGGFQAVDRVSFEIEAGAVWGFLGPNGAGKSTTIRMLCGILDPTSGEALVLGHDVSVDPDLVKQQIGYMSQKSSVWGDLTVREHLEFYTGLYGMAERASEAGIRTWLDRVDLQSVASRLGATLPGGFRQRLALACAAIHSPKILFLDEPTAGVDPVSRRHFWDIIADLAAEGVTVVVTTHYLDEAEHCTDLAFIFAGRIVARGSPSALKKDTRIGRVVEISSGDPARALECIERFPYVRSATLRASEVRATLDPAVPVERLGADMVDAHLPVTAIAPMEPSLEDAFAAIVVAAEGGGER